MITNDDLDLIESRFARKIDDRIMVGLSVHTKIIIEKTKMEMLDVLDARIDNIRENLNETAIQIFENMDFVTAYKNETRRYVDSQIKAGLSEEGIREFMETAAKNVTKDIFGKIINDVTREIILITVKKLDREYRVAKELCYSIDADIKHTLMRTPISYNSEGMIKDRLILTMEKVANNLLGKDIPRLIEEHPLGASDGK